MTAFIRTLVARVAYAFLSPVLWVLHVSGFCSTVLMMRGLERVRWHLGRIGVWTRYQFAIRNVPVYSKFLVNERCANSLGEFTLANVPSMDKGNYVKKFTLESRCVGGQLPKHGLMIDESSGSSGQATNWVRGAHERAANRRSIQLGLQSRLGKGELFFINAFALGPWATGINLTLSLSTWARIKTLGPDPIKILNTLREFGRDHHYVIMGYPPFLKQLADSTELNWSDYHVSMIFGGEGMGESMRRYLERKGIKGVYGSYGASDLELNIGAETELTIALRRLLEAKPELAKRVLQHAGAMPMIFQFNPADFFIESNDAGELLVTICRPRYAAPKIRYNIHDVGHVMRVPELKEMLQLEGITLPELDTALDLPLMFHYGRSDASVSYYGCKIPPADVQEALFRLPELAKRVDSFQVRTFDDDEGDKRLSIAMEVIGALPENAVAWQTMFFDSLAQVNQDFRESRRMVPRGKEPSIELHRARTGPFAGADIRIKRNYVLKDAA